MIIRPAVATQPPVEPTPEAPLTAPLSWTWVAPWLDASWALTDLSSPVIKLRGATGLGQVDPSHFLSEGVEDGTLWEGYRVGNGALVLPLQVRSLGQGSLAFLESHTAFMQSLDPAHQGLMRVERPDGHWREALCRYSGGADQAVELDPVMLGRASYVVTWMTDPYWRGEEVSVVFSSGLSSPFFPGPPWVLSAGEAMGGGSVTNPGDVSSRPYWLIRGPFTSLEVGVGSTLAKLDMVKGSGQYVIVDMRSDPVTLTDEAGADVWDALTDINFGAIAPGQNDIRAQAYGATAESSVELRFWPLYRRGY